MHACYRKIQNDFFNYFLSFLFNFVFFSFLEFDEIVDNDSRIKIYVKNILTYPKIQPIIANEIVNDFIADSSKLSSLKQLIDIELRQADMRKVKKKN